VAKKSFKGIPQVCPNKKKLSKEVPKKSPNCAQTIKKVQILFHPLFSGLVTSFKISPLLLGTISEKEMKQGKGVRLSMRLRRAL
jgi:hypothetical protein